MSALSVKWLTINANCASKPLQPQGKFCLIFKAHQPVKLFGGGGIIDLCPLLVLLVGYRLFHKLQHQAERAHIAF